MKPVCLNQYSLCLHLSLSACVAIIPTLTLTRSKDAVHTAAATIKQRMQEKGSLMIGFQSIPLHDDPKPANFFRMVVMSDIACNDDMDFLLNEIETLGADL